MQMIATEFPPRLAFGSRADPTWSTTISAAMSGYESAVLNWAHVRHTYDVSFAVRTKSDYDDIRDHFHQARGRGKKFLFRDPLDHSVSGAEGTTVEAGGGYQLTKTYGSGGDTYVRKITRPKSGTVAIFRTRTGVTTNVTANCTISYTTGTFTVSGHSNGDVYTWTGEFYVPCRYDTDRLPAAIINKEPGAAGELFVSCDGIPVVEVRE